MKASGPNVRAGHRHLLVLPDLVGRALGQDGALGHDDDAVGVLEDHVHVVLDDHGGDALAAHHGRDGIHDLALVAGGNAAGRLVQKQELGLQGIGKGHVKQLALALRQVAGVVVAFRGEAELTQDAVGLGRDGVVEVRQRHQTRGLALAREDCQRDVVEGGKIVEQVDDLEAAGDACLDPLGRRTVA